MAPWAFSSSPLARQAQSRLRVTNGLTTINLNTLMHKKKMDVIEFDNIHFLYSTTFTISSIVRRVLLR